MDVSNVVLKLNNLCIYIYTLIKKGCYVQKIYIYIYIYICIYIHAHTHTHMQYQPLYHIYMFIWCKYIIYIYIYTNTFTYVNTMITALEYVFVCMMDVLDYICWPFQLLYTLLYMNPQHIHHTNMYDIYYYIWDCNTYIIQTHMMYVKYHTRWLFQALN